MQRNENREYKKNIKKQEKCIRRVKHGQPTYERNNNVQDM